jgi:dTDP-4-amino-4,6-dideoxygalactose transaminase
MDFSPRPRFRYYGIPQIYATIIRQGAFGKLLNKGEDESASLARRVADLTGSANAICLPQARVGLYLAVRYLVRPGQNVILSPYTYFDVVNMVICAGARPVFGDVEPGTCNLDPAAVERLIDQDTGAVIATHLNGVICDIERISDLCRARGVAIVEDAAQCFGGQAADRHVGTFGDVGVFSLSHAKNVNALFGGIALMRDDAAHDYFAKVLSDFPPERWTRLLKRAAICFASDALSSSVVFPLLTFPFLRYDHLRGRQAGERMVQTHNRPVLRTRFPETYRQRMSSLQATLALKQLGGLEAACEQRIAYARLYREGLSDLKDVNLPTVHEDRRDVYLAFPIQVPDPGRVVEYMMRHWRHLRVPYYSNLADDPCYADYAQDCPNARAIADQTLLLPTYPSYGKAEVEKNIDVLRSYFGR